MIWITWRRYRTRFIVLALYMLILVFFMIMTLHGYHVAMAKCGTQAGMSFPETACAKTVHRAESHANYVSMGIGLLPFLVGLMLGAPPLPLKLKAGPTISHGLRASLEPGGFFLGG